MNQRIRELAEHAFRESAWYGGKRGDKDFDQRYNEKFAQLIVRECAQFVDSAISDGGVDGQSVKQHFGVEQ